MTPTLTIPDNSPTLNELKSTLRLQSSLILFLSEKDRRDETLSVITTQEIQHPVNKMGHTRANDLLYLNLLTTKNLPELFSLNPKYRIVRGFNPHISFNRPLPTR
jgi:hypothetical protein